MHAQTIEAANWWARSRGATSANWIANYQRSLTTRHRDVIVGAVRALGSVSTVLEVGSHCGPNLVRLAQTCPGIEQLTGVDVNAEAIDAGVAWVGSLGLRDRIDFRVGAVPAITSDLPDGCVDVVLSCYALAYIAPSDLDAVLYEMGRLAKRAVIVAEPMTDGSSAEMKWSVSGYSEWAHNYQSARQWIGTWRGRSVTTSPVTPPVDRLSTVLVAAFDESSPSAGATA